MAPRITNAMLMQKMETLEKNQGGIKTTLGGNGQVGLVKEFEQVKTRQREHFINHSKGNTNKQWAITTIIAISGTFISLCALVIITVTVLFRIGG